MGKPTQEAQPMVRNPQNVTTLKGLNMKGEREGERAGGSDGEMGR